jgi:putative DNA primase/helicase
MSETNGTAPWEQPRSLKVDPTSIPSELKNLHQWVCWQWVLRGGKWTKPPMQPDGRSASHSEPSTWVGFSEALRAYEQGRFAGIGVVVTADDPHVGVDLDKCRDPGTGVIERWCLSSGGKWLALMSSEFSINR